MSDSFDVEIIQIVVYIYVLKGEGGGPLGSDHGK